MSRRYAYLPTEFAVSPEGNVRALSYINNLHPEHKGLYCHLEELLRNTLPLFEHVLTDLHRNNPVAPRIIVPHDFLDLPWSPCEWADDFEWASWEARARNWLLYLPIKIADVPPTGYPGGLENRNRKVKLRGRTLQVVFHVFETKLVCDSSFGSNLTKFRYKQPGEPAFRESPWQVEGMKNEQIVACAYYYISVVGQDITRSENHHKQWSCLQENLVGNAIEFRMAVKIPVAFQGGRRDNTIMLWGLANDDPCRQHLGSVPIRPGLCVAFPNVYQHRHTAFTLADPSKEGHQRVIGIFLVDPESSDVPSTSRVPPQQKEWARREIEKLRVFPVELIDHIMDNVEGLMDAKEAEADRRGMLQERIKFRVQNEQRFFSIPCRTETPDSHFLELMNTYHSQVGSFEKYLVGF